MKKFLVTISEQRLYMVEADSPEEAFENVYDGEEMEMGCNDPSLVECEEVIEKE